MDDIINDVTIFLTSGIGIVLQIITIIAILIPGIKWLSQQLDRRIDDQVDEKLDPIVKDVCSQLTDVSTAMKTYKATTDTAIKYLDKAIAGLQGITTDNQINRYIKDHQNKED